MRTLPIPGLAARLRRSHFFEQELRLAIMKAEEEGDTHPLATLIRRPEINGLGARELLACFFESIRLSADTD